MTCSRSWKRDAEVRLSALAALPWLLGAVACGVDERVDDPAPGEPSSGPTFVEQRPSSCGGDCASREFAQWPITHSATEPGAFPFAFRGEGEWVVDAHTELAWTSEAFGPFTFQEASEHCARLGDTSSQPVRLPTRIELVSLLDRSRRPTVADAPFGSTPADYFWTTTPFVAGEELVFSVYFGLGETATGLKHQRSAHVRCVRGGRQVTRERLRRSGDELLDGGTQLVWELPVSSVPLPLAAARLYCSDRRRSSGQPWRLPTDKELQTLVDPRRSLPAVWVELEPETPPEPFWAQAPPGAAPLTVDFATGLALITEPDEKHFVRCVAWDGRDLSGGAASNSDSGVD